MNEPELIHAYVIVGDTVLDQRGCGRFGGAATLTPAEVTCKSCMGFLERMGHHSHTRTEPTTNTTAPTKEE